jgi:glycosyltransferase involved in cell wall biosynthesis
VDENDGIVEKNFKSKELLVSIIMPAFNSEATISESIHSVLNQTLNNWELIIVDDHSQDSTVQIIEKFTSTDQRIKLISLPKNGGLSNARNTGIKNSKGKYLSFLDADDLWHESKLEAQVALHTQNPTYRISHTNYDLLVEGKIRSRNRGQIFDYFYSKSGELYPQILYKNNIAILSVMVERELVLASNGFDSGLWAFEDQDLWIKIAQQKNQFGYLKQKLCYYRINPKGMSSNLGKYRRAYKFFLNKYESELLSSQKLIDAQCVYFNYFGLQFYKRGEFQLAFLYLLKAWRKQRVSPLKILFGGYLFLSLIQMYLGRNRKNNSW